LKFKTTFDLNPFPFQIGYDDELLFLGSCFAENISAFFETSKFQVVKNPYGILYNPVAINNAVKASIYEKSEVFYNSFEFNGVWSNFEAHSSLSASTEAEHLLKLKTAKEDLFTSLENSKVIFLSLGTAWAYKHAETGQYVANCHKIPQRHFHKKLLDMEMVISVLQDMIDNITSVNTNAKIVFTLSPVRHLKDGFVENQMSKSILHLSIQQVVKSNVQAFYFPSYELLLDDLRDYRFYASDLVHPNQMALDYIWEKIKMVFFEHSTLKAMAEVEKINKRLAHRFFKPDHPDAQLFEQKTQELISNLQTRYAGIKFN
jgi:hypothetical protein